MVPALVRDGSKALGNALRQTLEAVLCPNRMQKTEALKILDLSHGYTEKELLANFDRFYNANAARNGGSPYLQGKIKNAFAVVKHGARGPLCIRRLRSESGMPRSGTSSAWPKDTSQRSPH